MLDLRCRQLDHWIVEGAVMMLIMAAVGARANRHLWNNAALYLRTSFKLTTSLQDLRSSILLILL